MCGEKKCPLGSLVFSWGSPPHVRGKAKKNGGFCPGVGITPACAGKSAVCRVSHGPVWDHPRMCGEKACATGRGRTALGSPPHVRGKAAFHSRFPALAGITPACAGKRPRAAQRWTTFRDHPRMCGEKHRPSKTQSRPAGSPPHVRGKAAVFRSAPAILKDHPRMCGEKHRDSRIRMIQKGSPPHVRGKVKKQKNCPLVSGITPACAGKSGSCIFSGSVL